MRVFVAIDLDRETKDSLWGLVKELMHYQGSVRWVQRDAFHLTLKFLGEVGQDRLESLRDSLVAAADGLSPFQMQLKGTGVFPSFARPRVLWVGVAENRQLMDLQASVEETLVREGFQRQDRTFHPHITIGRVKSQKGLQRLLQELRRYKELDFGKIYVNQVVLMESILSPEGARYREVFSVQLKP